MENTNSIASSSAKAPTQHRTTTTTTTTTTTAQRSSSATSNTTPPVKMVTIELRGKSTPGQKKSEPVGTIACTLNLFKETFEQVPVDKLNTPKPARRLATDLDVIAGLKLLNGDKAIPENTTVFTVVEAPAVEVVQTNQTNDSKTQEQVDALKPVATTSAESVSTSQ